MSSPDVFRSSPLRNARQFESEVVISSSPDLPSLRDLASQVSRRPPIRSGSKAKPIPDGAVTTFTSAKDQWKLAQATAEQDASTDPVVEAPAGPPSKPKKTRKKPSRTKKTTVETETPQEPGVDEPWKKYKTSPISKPSTNNVREGTSVNQPEEKEKEIETDRKIQKKKKTGAVSNHFGPNQDITRDTTKKSVDDVPLQLESAMERRHDWTPPPVKMVSNIGLASDPHVGSQESSVDQDPSKVFKTLLTSYGCSEQAPQPSATTIEDSSFLKKRKLLELVSTTDASRPTSPAPEKSPTKQKAPKKKARTITELATAAYRPAEPSEPEPSVAEPGSFPALGETTDQAATGVQGKGKANASKKKAPRKSRKKVQPPKPILLSPNTALQEVSKQDFVFGTSSQLVREQSPTLLRDVQHALKHSEEIAFPIPLNSDGIEAIEPRKLWEAGARNEDGELFDSKVVDLIGDSPEVLVAEQDVDPFGYVKADCDNGPLISDPVADDSFETLSDILPSPSKNQDKDECDALPSIEHKQDCQETCVMVEDYSFETLSDVLPVPLQRSPQKSDDGAPLLRSPESANTNTQASGQCAKQQEVAMSAEVIAAAPSASADQVLKATDTTIQPPKYELYTDVQLSREITSFGFKPVRKRTAMLALLDQCWKSKAAIGAHGARSFSTSAKPSSAPTRPTEPPVSPARPRGRPRKNKDITQGDANTATQDPEPPTRPKRQTSKSRASPVKSSQQMEEPPPSAQPIETPKRGRGRPRKNSASPSLSSPSKSVTKKARTTASPRPRTPTNVSTIPKTVIEIPDSASEHGSETSVSRSSSPEQTFSPPPEVDLSVSMEEDTELSLSMTPDEKEAGLYSSLTTAITSAPRTNDPAKPSWHEKILMYDPIVLEDLTSWLNSGQLTRVGYDGEVIPGEVKKWCESQSVCCLWRVNLRGKERKRY